MKILLELNVCDSRTYLNFWDSDHGRDVVVEVRDGKLLLHRYDEATDKIEVSQEITLEDFVNRVVSNLEKA